MAHATTFDAFQRYDTHDKKNQQRNKEVKMNNNRIFDTLQQANRLKAAGVPDKQAEAQVEMMAEIIEDKLATKKDLEQVKSELILNMENNKKELEIKIELVKKDTIIKLASILGSLIVFCVGAATTILGFLIKLH